MVLRVINAWDSSQLSIQFIILIKVVQFLAIILISAEANHKVKTLIFYLACLEILFQNAINVCRPSCSRHDCWNYAIVTILKEDYGQATFFGQIWA